MTKEKPMWPEPWYWPIICIAAGIVIGRFVVKTPGQVWRKWNRQRDRKRGDPRPLPESPMEKHERKAKAKAKEKPLTPKQLEDAQWGAWNRQRDDLQPQQDPDRSMN